MYESFYALSEKPFSILPDPEFIYWTRGHSMAFTMLEYGVLNQAGFTVITGEIGCGKTTLIRQLLRSLDNDVSIGLLTNTVANRGHLLEWVMMAFDQPTDAVSYPSLYRQFQKYLIDEYGRGRTCVLIVDEAQNLGAELLEELRMLSNINADKSQLLQIVLVGQPQLQVLLRSKELSQFAQRISSDFHLGPLDFHEVIQYIDYRVAVVGGNRTLFSRGACAMIAHASRGIPRTINILCDTALVYGYSAGAKKITAQMVSRVLEDKAKFGLITHEDVSEGRARGNVFTTDST